MINNRIAFTVLVSITICLSISAQTVFEIDDFDAHNEHLELLGATAIHQKFLRLTPSKPGQVGAAWYSRKKVNLEKGFYSEFEFIISEKDRKYKGGDGFAFVIQNQGINAIDGQGDAIGYKGIPYVVAIELDIFNNEEESKNHVCLSFYDKDKEVYNRYATVHEIPEINDGEPHHARVEYTEGRLIFYLDSYIYPILSVKLDIAEKINSPENMAFVGFTSATSLAYANHDLLKWKLGEYVIPPDIEFADRIIKNTDVLYVKDQKVKISLWDNNIIDGDTISVRINDKWLISDYAVQREKKVIDYTMTGFETELVLFAHNIGSIPPNTAALSIDDGHTIQRIDLRSDMKTSESVRIKFKPGRQ